MSTEFVGISDSCFKECTYKNKEDFDHKHQALSIKQCQKLINKKKILQIAELLEKYIKLINQQTQKLIDKIMTNQMIGIGKLERSFIRIALAGETEPTERQIDVFKKLADYQFQGLKCSEVHQVLANPSKKERLTQDELEEQAEVFFLDYKNSLIRVVKQNIAYISQKESYIKDVERSKISMYDQEKNFHDLSLSGGNKLVDETTEFQIDFDESVIFFQSKSQDNIMESLMEKIDKLDHSTHSQDILQKKGETFFAKKRENSEIIQLSAIKNEKQLAFVKSKGISSVSTKINSQSMSVASSYVNYNEGKYYIPVQYLKKAQYKKQKNVFNIRLKVVKQLFFRLFHDEKSNKTHKKIKFIGGDETGIVVCYTNYIPEISEGKYVTLHDCSLTHFYNTSYEVTSHKCKPSTEGSKFEVSLLTRISAFHDKQSLTYIIQKNDSYWPSIGCLQYFVGHSCKNLAVIAKVEDFLCEAEGRISCSLSDGTGKIYAQIYKTKGQQIQEGKVYYFKNLQVVIKKPQNINCVRTRKFVSETEQEIQSYAEIKGFKYD